MEVSGEGVIPLAFTGWGREVCSDRDNLRSDPMAIIVLFIKLSLILNLTYLDA